LLSKRDRQQSARSPETPRPINTRLTVVDMCTRQPRVGSDQLAGSRYDGGLLSAEVGVRDDRSRQESTVP